MSEHEHNWRWIGEIVVRYDEHDRATYYNAECESCGARTWAHGWMPGTMPAPAAQPTPTTERS